MTQAGSRFRLRLVAAAVAVTSLTATGCGDDGSPQRPVTMEEAQQFALARFSRFEASPVRVRMEVPQGSLVSRITGTIDYRTHRAVGRYTSAAGAGGTTGTGGPDTERKAATGLIAWDAGGLGVAPDQGKADRPDRSSPDRARPERAAAQLPPTAWSPRAYTTDTLDRALRLSQQLGLDRPENAQLIAQGGARWMRQETLDGRVHDVFSAPRPARDAKNGRKKPSRSEARDDTSPLTFWVDSRGTLRRVEARMGDPEKPVRIDFGRTTAKVPDQPWGGPPRSRQR